MWKVEFRKNCKICNEPLKKGFRSFCSKKCRQKTYSKKYAEYNKKWQQEKRGEYKPNKLKCKICGRWYIQVGSHIIQRHKITARAYREIMDLPVKRGITPKWFRKLKGEQAINNKTYKNLNKGRKNWSTKGDTRAKTNTFWKSHRRNPDEYYN